MLAHGHTRKRGSHKNQHDAIPFSSKFLFFFCLFCVCFFLLCSLLFCIRQRKVSRMGLISNERRRKNNETKLFFLNNNDSSDRIGRRLERNIPPLHMIITRALLLSLFLSRQKRKKNVISLLK